MNSKHPSIFRHVAVLLIPDSFLSRSVSVFAFDVSASQLLSCVTELFAFPILDSARGWKLVPSSHWMRVWMTGVRMKFLGFVAYALVFIPDCFLGSLGSVFSHLVFLCVYGLRNPFI